MLHVREMGPALIGADPWRTVDLGPLRANSVVAVDAGPGGAPRSRFYGIDAAAVDAAAVVEEQVYKIGHGADVAAERRQLRDADERRQLRDADMARMERWVAGQRNTICRLTEKLDEKDVVIAAKDVAISRLTAALVRKDILIEQRDVEISRLTVPSTPAPEPARGEATRSPFREFPQDRRRVGL
jgi:hypothetical protein